MKITIYTVKTCPFCQKEKEYLQKNNLQFEEKDLETNKEYLKEMLAVSNNFAGTPVTKIEKDNGETVVLKGFTKEEFDQVLGIEQTTAEETKTPSASTKPDDKSDKAIVDPSPPAPQPVDKTPIEVSSAPTAPPVAPKPETAQDKTPTESVDSSFDIPQDSKPPAPAPSAPPADQTPEPIKTDQTPSVKTPQQEQPAEKQPSSQSQPQSTNDPQIDDLLKELQQKTAGLTQEVSQSAEKITPKAASTETAAPSPSLSETPTTKAETTQADTPTDSETKGSQPTPPGQQTTPGPTPDSTQPVKPTEEEVKPSESDGKPSESESKPSDSKAVPDIPSIPSFKE